VHAWPNGAGSLAAAVPGKASTAAASADNTPALPTPHLLTRDLYPS
jgi:hypothetical protein